ncbi:Uncharacterized protein OBRU01_08784 [Operophtera brumata]|uniref:Uncharacterized protein n=1 Tax=Operophtera brumata TaxID=104452 RepID=A0A0L7L291_OPEBR|nr:Uncharacterized protein OBRU01_08784 [Operophtera brumata]
MMGLQVLQLCRAAHILPRWYSANINDGFQPKPISEIFTTESVFSTSKPIVVTQKISNSISDEIDSLSTLAPPTSRSESTRLTQQTFTPTTSMPAGALYQQDQQFIPLQQVDILPQQQTYLQPNVPSYVPPVQLIPNIQQRPETEPQVQIVSEVPPQITRLVNVQPLVEPGQTFTPGIPLSTLFQPQTQTSQINPTSSSSVPPILSVTNPPPSSSLRPPNSNYFLIYQQAPQSIQSFPSSSPPSGPGISEVTIRESTPSTVTLPPLTSEAFSTTRTFPLSTISTTPLPADRTSILSSSSVTITPSSTLGLSNSGCIKSTTAIPGSIKGLDNKGSVLPFPVKIRVIAPTGSITNVNINPLSTTRKPMTKSTRKPTTRRTSKPKKNSYDRCLDGCRKVKDQICAAPLSHHSIDPKKLRGFPSKKLPLSWKPKMLTRKQKKLAQLAVDDSERKKSAQYDLNESLRLNEHLLQKQLDGEKEFTCILEVNQKLKNQLRDLETSYNELKHEHNINRNLLSLYQMDRSELEQLVEEKIKLEHLVQKLKEETKIDCQCHELDRVDKTDDLKLELNKYRAENIELRLTIVQKEVIINNFKKGNEDNIEFNTDDAKKELAEIRSELRFKNAELKILRKERHNLGKGNSSIKRINRKDIIELQGKYKKQQEDSDSQLQLLENYAKELREKKLFLENSCNSLRTSYDNLSIEHYKNERENAELSQTLKDMETILQESGEEALAVNTTQGTINFTEGYTGVYGRRRKNIIVIGDECVQGLGIALSNSLESHLDVCCYSYKNASIDFLIDTARRLIVDDDEESILALVFVTRKLGVKHAKTYVDGITGSIGSKLTLKQFRAVIVNFIKCNHVTRLNKISHEESSPEDFQKM